MQRQRWPPPLMTALAASMAAGLPIRRLSRPLSALAKVEAIGKTQGAEGAPKFWCGVLLLATRHLARFDADGTLAVLAEAAMSIDPGPDYGDHGLH